MDKFSNIFYNLYKSNGIFKQAINLVRRIIGKFTLILFRGIFSLAVAARIVKVLYAEAFKYFDTLYLGNDFTSKIEQILDKKLTCIDVGARGKFPEVVLKYIRFFETVQCEPESKEAERLRNLGKKVIEDVIYSKKTEIDFYETRDLHASSIYKPQGPFLDLYNSDPAYIARYEAVQIHKLMANTLKNVLEDLQVQQIDFLKIDVQGAEKDVLEGLGDYRPLLLIVELQFLPLYHDVPYGSEILNYLNKELGYIPFILSHNFNGAMYPNVKDGFFMPNWMDPRGRKLILEREKEYIALMLMFGQTRILKHVANKIDMKNKSFILKINDVHDCM